MKIRSLEFIYGAGGNYGHAGRPGKRGGSAPGSRHKQTLKKIGVKFENKKDPFEQTNSLAEAAYQYSRGMNEEDMDHGAPPVWNVGEIQKEADTHIKNGEMDLRGPSGTNATYAAHLLHAIINSPPAPALYRGYGAHEGETFKVGDVKHMSVASFSSKPSVAKTFAEDNDVEGGGSVLFKLKPGAKAFEMHTMSAEQYQKDGEYLTTGEFKVTKVTRPKSEWGPTTVEIAQVSVPKIKTKGKIS